MKPLDQKWQWSICKCYFIAATPADLCGEKNSRGANLGGDTRTGENLPSTLSCTFSESPARVTAVKQTPAILTPGL